MIETLNSDQLQAVTTTARHSLVLASAGTGKTHVLTARFIYAVDFLGMDPTQILAVTFTRKAAGELRRRIVAALNRPDLDPESLWIGTFHAICSRILRTDPGLAGLPDYFTLIMPDEAKMLMTNVIGRLDPEAQNIDRRAAATLRYLDTIKNHGADVAKPMNEWPKDAPRPMINDQKVIAEYTAALNNMACVDYGDLICKATSLLTDNPVIQKAWQQRFSAILVDEYQDTNPAQQRLIQALLGAKAIMTCVGDDDQSINRFRGANIEAILTFKTTYPDAEIINLRTNYRCSPDIIERSAQMMNKNKNRHPKVSEASEPRPGKVTAVAHDGFPGLIAEISRIIAERPPGAPWNSIAVLGRTNQQCSRISALLAERNIPVHLLTPDATNSPPLNKLLAWIRITINPYDDAALATIAQGVAPPMVIDNIFAKARLERTPITEQIETLAAQAKFNDPTLIEIVRQVKAIASLVPINTPAETIEAIMQTTGIGQIVDSLPQASKARFWRLYAALVDPSKPQRSLREIVDTAQNELVDSDIVPDAVIVSTMHSMKGLQAPTIISPGWEKGEFPMKLRNPDPKDLEEERRVAFVTITRASDNAWLLYDKTKGPSPFLNDLGLAGDAK